MFSRVYGPILVEEREDFWAELSAIRGLRSDPWCVGRDFNVVRFLEQIRYCQRMSTSIRHFLEVIEELHLKDLPLSSGLFTWCGGLNNCLAYRLGCFLISDD